MGVTRFYAWLAETKGACLSLLQSLKEIDDRATRGVHHVFVDLQHALYEGLNESALGVTRDPTWMRLWAATWADLFGAVRASLGLELEGRVLRTSALGAVAAHACAFLWQCVGIARPTGVVCIALDGVAPASKHLQQRRRRYESGRDWEKSQSRRLVSEDLLVLPPEQVDSAAFSPGSELMQIVDVAVRVFLGHLWASDVAHRGPFARVAGVWFSPSADPGEGEHKVFDAARWLLRLPDSVAAARPSAWQWGKVEPSAAHADPSAPWRTHVVFGADSDLVILTLVLRARCVLAAAGGSESACKDDFLVLRRLPRSNRFGTPVVDVTSHAPRPLPPRILHAPHRWDAANGLGFSVVDCRRLWQLLVPELLLSAPALATPNQEAHAVLDFATLMCCVGNDFLPHLAGFTCDKKPMRHLLHAYRASHALHPAPLLHLLAADASAADASAADASTLAAAPPAPWRSLASMPDAWAVIDRAGAAPVSALHAARLVEILRRLRDAEEAALSTMLEGLALVAAEAGEERGEEEGEGEGEGEREGEGEGERSGARTEDDDGPADEGAAAGAGGAAADGEGDFYRERGASALSACLGLGVPARGAAGVGATPNETMQAMVEGWWAGVAWVSGYYAFGVHVATWEWSYPWFSAPRVADIVRNVPGGVAANPIAPVRRAPTAPLLPAQHMVAVVPCHSWRLLPAPLRALAHTVREGGRLPEGAPPHFADLFAPIERLADNSEEARSQRDLVLWAPCVPPRVARELLPA